MLDDTDTRIAKWVQNDIPLTLRPFRSMARKLGMTERQVLDGIRRLAASGAIRKFGAIVRHQKAGYTNNLLILWAVPPERIHEVGKTLAAFSEITHCYLREPAFEGRYNVFSMAHLADGGSEALLEKLTQATSLTDYRLLASLEEFKKSSMEYFS